MILKQSGEQVFGIVRVFFDLGVPRACESSLLKEAQHLCVCIGIGCHLSCRDGVRNFLMFNNKNFKFSYLFIYL